MKKILFVSVLALLILPSVSMAAYLKADKDISLPLSEKISENAYIAGGMVNVAGPVAGDLFVAGRSLFISSKISGDLTLAGANINVAGAEAEDVRMAGADMNLDGVFSGEVFAAGSQLVVSADTKIGKDLYFKGASINLNGTIAGDVTIKGVRSLVIGPNAIVSGDLHYYAQEPASIDPSAKIAGEVIFHKVAARDHDAQREPVAARFLLGIFTLIFLVKLLAILLAACLLWYLRHQDSVSVLKHVFAGFGKAVLRGFVFLVVVPIAIAIICFTLIGIPVAFFAGLVYLALLMLAAPVAVILITSLLLKKRTSLRWFDILLGAVVLGVVGIVPIIGWAVCFLIYLAGLGGLLQTIKIKFESGE